MKMNFDNFKQLFLLATEEETEIFSDEALEAIFDALEEISPSMGFDPIAIRCQWTERTEEDLLTDYGYLLEEDGEDGEDEEEKLINVLREKTFIKRLKNGNFLIEDF